MDNKETYVSPEVKVLEIKMECYVLQVSKPDYVPEEW